MVPDFQGLACYWNDQMCAFKNYGAVLSHSRHYSCVLALVISDTKVGKEPVGSGGFPNASLGRLDLSKADGRRW